MHMPNDKPPINYKNRLRGLLYWALSTGPFGTIAGLLFRRNCFDLNGGIALPKGSRASTAGTIIFGLYEYPERVLIKKWLPTNLDCVELGCSIGVISRVILHHLDNRQRLLAVEASEQLLQLAQRNVASAHLDRRFLPVHGAVHYSGKTVRFSESAENLRGKVEDQAQSCGIDTPCVTLAHLIADSGVQTFSLVMDIEGSEFDLIANDAAALVKCRAIVAEVHGDQSKCAHFADILRSQGFTLVEVKHSVFAFLRDPEHE